jgi:hypothetical protein
MIDTRHRARTQPEKEWGEKRTDTQRLETDSGDLSGEENVGPLSASGLQDPADHSLYHTSKRTVGAPGNTKQHE